MAERGRTAVPVAELPGWSRHWSQVRAPAWAKTWAETWWSQHGSRRTATQVLTVAALGAAVWAFLSVAAQRHGFFDLRVYFGAINYWVHSGGQLYDYLLPRTEYGFTYPPFAAVLMAPMSLVSWNAAVFASLAMSVVSMVVILQLLVGPIVERHGWPRWFAIAISFELAAAFEPIRETINFGQVNLTLLAIVAVDLLLLVRRNHRCAGLLVGIATAVKLTPGVFIIYLLVTRRWRAAGLATAAAAGSTWLAATLAPDASRVFWTDAIWNTGRVGSTAFVSNQSLNGIVSRFNPLEPSVAMWGAVLLVAFTIWMVRVRRAVAGRDEPAALALTGIFGCLASPISWVHHLVWVLPALILLVDHALDFARPVRDRRWLLGTAVVAYAILCSRAVWSFEFSFTGWGMIGGNLYAIVMCLLLLGLPLRELAGPEPLLIPRGRLRSEVPPDLVELDRRVNAAFTASDASKRGPNSGEPKLVGVRRP